MIRCLTSAPNRAFKRSLSIERQAHRGRLLCLLPLGHSRDTASDFLVDNQDGETKGCIRIKVLGGCVVSQRTTHPARMVTRIPAETVCQGICKEKSHWKCCDKCFLPCRETLSGQWHGTKTGRKVGLTPVGKSAICLASMVPCFVSLFHKTN